MKNPSSPRIAIVHDWLYGGGAELVVLALHKMYPEAPIYTSYCSDSWRQKLDGRVVTGYLQKWPFSAMRKFLPVLRQRWFRKLDLSGYDIIISSSGNGEAKFVSTNKDQHHICYCHTPTHFYWRKYDEYLKNPGFKPQWLARLGLRLLLRPLRKKDYQAAQNVDLFIANSTHIQKDIEKYYDSSSIIVHPPVDTKRFKKRKTENGKRKTENGYITWGRHVPYKRFDLAIQACNKLQLPLTVVGSGPETDNLKGLAGSTITFTGRVSDEELVRLAHTASAFIFPGEEDFGIAPVEALAASLPVIAYKAGGALDYITPGQTGIFFEQQTTSSLMGAIDQFNSNLFNQAKISQQAEQFSILNFEKDFAAVITSLLSE